MKTDFLKKIRNKYNPIEIMGTVYGAHNYADSPAMLYHENSKLTPYSSRIFGNRILRFNNEFFHSRASQPYKNYPGTEKIYFEDFTKNNFPHSNIFELISKRRSIRKFEKHTISLEELYFLLHYSYGISIKLPIKGMKNGCWSYRSVPSGGALYPLEIYVAEIDRNNSSCLYHYRPDINGMEIISKGNQYNELKDIISAEPNIDLTSSSCVIFITCVFERVLIKYGERGYRFALME